MKSWIFLFLICILTLMSGCTGLYPKELHQVFPQTFQFHPDETFNYSIQTITLKPNGATSSHITTRVISMDEDLIRMEYNEQKTDSNPSGQPFIIELTPHGEVINSTRPEPIIQEIETQFPHILQFPSNILQKGSNWKIPFQKNGKYNSQDGSVAYTINGESMYTENGFVTITTPAGTYDCLEIIDNTTYSRNVSFTRSNITTVTETEGTITGKIWIEKHEGFLVKSEKKISLLVQSDLTDLFNQRYQKYDAVYRESPIEQEIVSELVP